MHQNHQKIIEKGVIENWGVEQIIGELCDGEIQQREQQNFRLRPDERGGAKFGHDIGRLFFADLRSSRLGAEWMLGSLSPLCRFSCANSI